MKRGRAEVEEGDLIDRDAASRFVLGIVEDWTDPCGEEFELDIDVEVGSKQIRVSVDGIPEIHGSFLTEAIEEDNGKMCVSSIEVDFAKGRIVFGVKRSASGPKRRRIETRRGAVSPTEWREPCVPLESGNAVGRSRWMDKIVERVDASDQEDIVSALFLIEKWDEKNFSGDFKARLKLQPSMYIITVTGLVTLEANQLPIQSSIIYVSQGKIEVMVRKSEPDV